MKLSYVLMVTLAAAALAGCETTGSTPNATAMATATPAKDPPLTHAKAAEQCWMATEKGHADQDLDKRVDVVDKCIAEKMKAAQAAPKS